MAQDTPEYLYSEKPTLDQLQQMDWQHIEGDGQDASITERENFKQVLLTDRLKAAIQHINLDDNGNPWLSLFCHSGWAKKSYSPTGLALGTTPPS